MRKSKQWPNMEELTIDEKVEKDAQLAVVFYNHLNENDVPETLAQVLTGAYFQHCLRNGSKG